MLKDNSISYQLVGLSPMRTFERSHLALRSFCSYALELASVFWTSSMHRTISAVLCTCAATSIGYSQKNRLLLSCMQMARKALLVFLIRCSCGPRSSTQCTTNKQIPEKVRSYMCTHVVDKNSLSRFKTRTGFISIMYARGLECNNMQ
jgi:hypothetical protein